MSTGSGNVVWMTLRRKNREKDTGLLLQQPLGHGNQGDMLL